MKKYHITFYDELKSIHYNIDEFDRINGSGPVFICNRCKLEFEAIDILKFYSEGKIPECLTEDEKIIKNILE